MAIPLALKILRRVSASKPGSVKGSVMTKIFFTTVLSRNCDRNLFCYIGIVAQHHTEMVKSSWKIFGRLHFETSKNLLCHFVIHINITKWTTLHLSTLAISLITSCLHLSIPKSFICPHKNRNSSISFTPTNTAIQSIPSQPRLQGLTKERSTSYNSQGKCDLCQPQGCHIHLLVFRWHEAMNTWQHSHSLVFSHSIVCHPEVLLFVMDQIWIIDTSCHWFPMSMAIQCHRCQWDHTEPLLIQHCFKWMHVLIMAFVFHTTVNCCDTAGINTCIGKMVNMTTSNCYLMC